MTARPDFELERMLHRQGFAAVAGLDEVGRGCLAGPVAAGAVVLPRRPSFDVVSIVRDSKQLSRSTLESAYEAVAADAVTRAVGWASPAEIDRVGIAAAVRIAMRRALSELDPLADHLLIDAIGLPSTNLPQRSIIRGDSKSLSIAAAAIVAKVERDRFMVSLAERHPDYGFEAHKGYATERHRSALERFGPCPVHRMSFAPVLAQSHRVEPLLPSVSGAWAETFAAVALENRGMTLLTRNYRTRYGEIDLIMADGNELVFIEVRARQSQAYGSPAETVSAGKAHRIVAACEEYLQGSDTAWADWRIDVAAVLLDRWNRPMSVEFIESAVEDVE